MALENKTTNRKENVEETSTRKPLSRPGGNHPARQGLTIHRKRALAGDSEMTPSSVGSELQSRVIEPRNIDERGSLRVCDSEGHVEAPQWSGVEVRPGSKNRAEAAAHGTSGGRCMGRESSNGVFREAGRASCLLGKCRIGSPRLTKVQDRGRAFGPRSPRIESTPRNRAPSLMRRRKRRAEAVLASP